MKAKISSAKKESLNTRIAVIISYATLVINVIGHIFVTQGILNSVGTSNYGIYSFALSISSWITVISNALTASFIRFSTIDQHEHGDSKITSTIFLKLLLLISLTFTIIFNVVIFALYFGGFRLQQYDEAQHLVLTYVLCISSISILFTISLSVFPLFNQFKKEFIFVRVSYLIYVIAQLLITWVIALTTYNIVYVAIGTASTHLIYGGMNLIFAIKKMKFRVNLGVTFKKYKDLTLQILKFSSLVLVTTVVNQVNNEIGKTILGFMTNEYNVTEMQLSMSFTTYLVNIASYVYVVFIPKINDYVIKEEKEKINELFLRVSKFQIIVILLIIGGFITSGSFFTTAWLDDQPMIDPYNIYLYTIVLFITNLMPLSINITQEIQRAMNLLVFRTVNYLVSAALNIGVSIALVALLPSDLSVWGTVIGYAFSSFVCLWIINNVYNAKRVRLSVGKYSLTLLRHCLITGAVIGITIGISFAYKDIAMSQWFTFIITGFIYVILYALSVLIFDRKFVFSFLPKRKSKPQIVENKE